MALFLEVLFIVLHGGGSCEKGCRFYSCFIFIKLL